MKKPLLDIDEKVDGLDGTKEIQDLKDQFVSGAMEN